MMAAAAAEVSFAQRLASNEARDRHRALKKLRKYIGARASQTGFTREELRKLWKGLHYSMWMQDKPLLQEELASKISQLLLTFSDPAAALNFAAAFFATESNEWNRLDHWRMDKFMMLVREFLHLTFEVVHHAGWADNLVTQLVQVIEDEVMSPENEELADGLRLHVADIYLEELEKVGADKVTGDQIVQLLRPFITYLQRSDRALVADRVSDKVFGSVLKDAQKHSNEEEEDKPRLKYDLAALSKFLLDSGRAKDCPQRNRARLYKIVKRINTLMPATTEPIAAEKRKSEDTPKKKKKKRNKTEEERS